MQLPSSYIERNRRSSLSFSFEDGVRRRKPVIFLVERTYHTNAAAAAMLAAAATETEFVPSISLRFRGGPAAAAHPAVLLASTCDSWAGQV